MRHSFCIDRLLYGQYGQPTQQQLGFLFAHESRVTTHDVIHQIISLHYGITLHHKYYTYDVIP